MKTEQDQSKGMIRQTKIRIVSWNIRAGGGTRIEGIEKQIQKWRADIVTLSEFRGTPPSQNLSKQLFDWGLNYQLMAINQDAPATNGLLLASRFPLVPIESPFSRKDSTRWLLATVAAKNSLSIGCMHIPNRVSGRKYLFYNKIISIVRKWTHGQGLLIGDTNSGLPEIDEESSAFGSQEEAWFHRLDAHGWVDGFRHLKGNQAVFTWYSPNGNNGFRLDQAFINPALLPFLSDIRYEWGKSHMRDKNRTSLSDHAAIILDLELE